MPTAPHSLASRQVPCLHKLALLVFVQVVLAAVSFASPSPSSSLTSPRFLSKRDLLGAGVVCGEGQQPCTAGLSCKCLALNRGLYACQPEGFLSLPSWAAAYERKGLTCAVSLPQGARPLAPPPLLESNDSVIDPRNVPDVALAAWARGPAKGFYTKYYLVHAPGDSQTGVPVLAGADVSESALRRVAQALKHLLVDAATSSRALQKLSENGVRFLIGKEDDWQRHPEFSREFTTGLGGGAPWFPSCGVADVEPPQLVMEEMLHTMQYVAMAPREVCMYHKAYARAVTSKLYTTDGSGDEVEGEPVPTVQADEYLAMALQRWLGSNAAPDEYFVHGNTKERTGREDLRRRDPNAFCLISRLLWSDDTWNPEPDGEPWRSNPNRGIDRDEVEAECRPILEELAISCPPSGVEWSRDGWPRRVP